MNDAIKLTRHIVVILLSLGCVRSSWAQMPIYGNTGAHDPSTITHIVGTAFTDAGRVNGTTYHYVVSAANVTGDGAHSAQANTLAAGLGTNWFDVSGSSLTNTVLVPVDSNNGSVFYRLVYP